MALQGKVVGSPDLPYPYHDLSKLRKYSFNTLAIASAHSPDEKTGALIAPIYMTSTYINAAPGVYRGYDYSRCSNPTYSNVEQQIAALENGEYGLLFGSGLGAMTSLLSDLRAGDKIGAVKSCYGGTYRLITTTFEQLGVEAHFVYAGDYEEAERVISTENLKLFIFESPTNPLLEVIDIQRITNLCKKHGVISVFDNTFATPWIQNALDLGADVILHSCSKYLAGHSDIILGAIVTRNKDIYDKCYYRRRTLGLNPSPFDAWLLCRSIKSLGARMAFHTSSALAFAKHFENHEFVKKVYYPGLESSPYHKVAAQQMKRGFGGMVSIVFNFEQDSEMVDLLNGFQLFHLAESLGGALSLVCQPATMTHASTPASVRKEIGLEDSLLRFSIGLEDVNDLIADVESSIANVLKKAVHTNGN